MFLFFVFSVILWAWISRHDRALDVCSGTGQPTVLLTEIADRVIGIDLSADMLKQAMPHPHVEYRQFVAEDTPFCDGRSVLITASPDYSQTLHCGVLLVTS